EVAGWTREMVKRRISKMTDNLKRLERAETLESVVFTGTGRQGFTQGRFRSSVDRAPFVLH
ncbi:MAG: hypothetical protein M1541_04420, partial [Acidobacteria bacterium]|nr:hypothetical protein [Acidobacteriota bacterium]